MKMFKCVQKLDTPDLLLLLLSLRFAADGPVTASLLPICLRDGIKTSHLLKFI